MKKQLIIAAVVIIVLTAIVLGVFFFKKDCVIPEIVDLPEKPQAGQTITFKIKGEPNQMLSWDFGDGTTFDGIDSALHVYDAPDNYVVTVVTADKCQAQKQVIVDPAHKLERVTPVVSFPSEIVVGEQVTFADSTKEASEWSWKIPELNETGNFSSYTTTIQHEGIYHIVLSIKGIYIKGDTTIEFAVLSEPGGEIKTRKDAEPLVEVAKPRPEAMPKPESNSRKKALAAPPKPRTEPVIAAKRETVVKPKPEPKPKPAVEAKPTPAPAVKPAKPALPVYMKDAEFSQSFIEIANALSEEGNNSSDEWREKIVAQSGAAGSIKILLIEGGREPKEMTLENFKKQQIIASTPYNVNAVKDIKRKKDNSINQITVIATKN